LAVRFTLSKAKADSQEWLSYQNRALTHGSNLILIDRAEQPP